MVSLGYVCGHGYMKIFQMVFRKNGSKGSVSRTDLPHDSFPIDCSPSQLPFFYFTKERCLPHLSWITEHCIAPGGPTRNPSNLVPWSPPSKGHPKPKLPSLPNGWLLCPTLNVSARVWQHKNQNVCRVVQRRAKVLLWVLEIDCQGKLPETSFQNFSLPGFSGF